MSSEWNFAPEVIVKAQEIGIGARVVAHWTEAEAQDQGGTVVGVEIHRYGKVAYTVHLDGDISPTDGFSHDLSGQKPGTISLRSGGEEKNGVRPADCRDRLQDEGKPFPKSGCASCGTGGISGCPHATSSCGVGVKPLEWHGPDMHGEIHARSVLCVYSILSKQPNGHWLTEVGGYHPSVDLAKAAAQADYERRILSALTNTDLSLRAENERLRKERDAAVALAERLKLEAQGHASEARTANATIYEIYQVLSGSSGEPGNWNGAEPARAFVAATKAKLGEAAKVLERALIGNPTIESPEDHVQYFVGCIEAALANLKGAE